MILRRLLRAFVAMVLAVVPLVAQLRMTGQATAGFFKSDNGLSQYTIDQGRATFAWRWDLFADAAISENISFFSNVRMLQDQVLHIDRFSIRVKDVASTGVSVEAGQIDIP